MVLFCVSFLFRITGLSNYCADVIHKRQRPERNCDFQALILFWRTALVKISFARWTKRLFGLACDAMWDK